MTIKILSDALVYFVVFKVEPCGTFVKEVIRISDFDNFAHLSKIHADTKPTGKITRKKYSAQ